MTMASGSITAPRTDAPNAWASPTAESDWRRSSVTIRRSRSHRGRGQGRQCRYASRGLLPRRRMAPAPDALRVVVADDEALARRMLTTLLAREPEVAVVAECSNGPETIEAVRTHAPDVLFLDVRMPGATGIEVLERLGPDAVRAVVLVTAFDAYAVSAFDHHALDYVLKPVDADRFRTTMQRVRGRLQQHRSTTLVEETVRALAQVYGVASRQER